MRHGITRSATAALIALLSASATAASVSIGSATVQALVAQQLFNRSGRWYLQDDGGVCYAYLESPRTRLMDGRIYLDAHLSSRLGQRIGNYCAGVGLASNVTLSGRVQGQGSKVSLDDIRVEHVDDGATGSAIDLIQQLAPQAIPKALTIDIATLIRSQPTQVAGYPVSLDQLTISEVTVRTDAIAVKFDFALSSP